MEHDLIAWETLRSGPVRLVPHDPDQDALTVAWLNDPSVQRGFAIERTFTVEGHRAWLREHPEVHILPIVDDRGGGHVGNTLLTVNARHRSAYFQIYLGPHDARGRGTGRIATRLALRVAFVDLSLHRVWLHVLPDNHAAVRIYEGEGFQREGVERDALFLGDRFVSQVRMSLLDDEYRRRGVNPCASP
jgi:RimJ/RimL family protein N-acetyltransferase